MNHSDKRSEENSKRLEAAIAALQAALSRLERTVADKLEDELSSAELEEELAIMQDDRSRLALDLDAALARQNTLEKGRDEVLRRLENASEGVVAALSAAVITPAREN
jgi:predicted  nucleic acid-binding Zn-ribbon protein